MAILSILFKKRARQIGVTRCFPLTGRREGYAQTGQLLYHYLKMAVVLLYNNVY